MDPTLFSLQHFSDSTSLMVRRRRMAARSGERLVVGDISMSVRALACWVHCLGGFYGKKMTSQKPTGATVLMMHQVLF